MKVRKGGTATSRLEQGYRYDESIVYGSIHVPLLSILANIDFISIIHLLLYGSYDSLIFLNFMMFLHSIVFQSLSIELSSNIREL
jgi:hypothetical protein